MDFAVDPRFGNWARLSKTCPGSTRGGRLGFLIRCAVEFEVSCQKNSQAQLEGRVGCRIKNPDSGEALLNVVAGALETFLGVTVKKKKKSAATVDWGIPRGRGGGEAFANM